MTVVVDASLALDGCFQSERTPSANSVLDHVFTDGGVVPRLWLSEVANGPIVLHRRGRMTAAKVVQAVARLATPLSGRRSLALGAKGD